MLKKFIGASVALAMVLPFVASAASTSFTNVQFSNNDVTISGTGGSTVSGKFHLTVAPNQVVENVETDVIGDNLAPVCTSVGDNLGLQEGTYDVPFTVTLPPNTGTYTLQVKVSGIYGGFRAIDCNDNVVTGPVSFSSALRVVASSVSTGSPFGSGSIADLIAALRAAGVLPAVTPAPSVSPVCSAYAQASVGSQYGVVNSANVRLQGFLLSQNESIPALAAGASFGFYLGQTQAAVSHFLSVNHCN